MNTEETELRKEIKDLSACSICFNALNDPRTLPCLHNFCLRCLQETGEHANLGPGENMACPICREKFEIPKLGWSNLKRNFCVQRLVDISKSLTQTDSETHVPCDACQSNCELESNVEIPNASVYCVDCKDNLCDRCHGEHKRHKLSKGHTIINECRMKQKQYTCGVHETKHMTQYCATCKKIICDECSVNDHSEHSYSDVERNAATFRKAIESYLKETDTLVEELMSKKLNLEQKKEMLRKTTDVEDALNELADYDRKLTLDERCSRKHTMEKHNAIESDEIERKLAILDSFKMYCSKIISEGLPCEICSSYDEICYRADVLHGKIRGENHQKKRRTSEENVAQNDGYARKQNLPTLINEDTAGLLKDFEYMKIQSVVDKPMLVEESYQASWNRVLRYIVQRLQMWNGYVLYAQNLSDIMSATLTCDESSSVPFEYPVSRLDFVAYIFNFADCFVAQDVMRIMSKFPMTLPFILPDIFHTGKYIVTLPYLKTLTIKWESTPGNIIENHLFSSPFRLVVAVRLGSGDTGKSVILNQLMAKQFIFSSCTEPGHKFGRPYTLDGTVEIVCLTRETCSDTTWKMVHEYYKTHDEVAILANLHGDATLHKDTLMYLKQFGAAFVVFLMPDATEENYLNLKEIVRDNMILPVRVVEKQKKGVSSNVPLIETCSLHADDTHEIVRKLLLSSLNGCSGCSSPKDDSLLPNSLLLANDFMTEEAKNMVGFVQLHGCSRIKDFIRTICYKDEGKWIPNEEIETLVDLTLNIFRGKDAESTKKSLTYLEIEFSKLSAKESLIGRSKVMEAKENLRRMVKPSKISNDGREYEEFQNKQRDAQRDLKLALDEVDNITLGQEHFFRLIGHLFKQSCCSNAAHDLAITLNLPNHYADLLIGGHAIELLNGDSGMIQLTWIRAIFKRVQKKLPTVKVFVISIIGLQSSGKSTLLNALFSCRFAVSVGRCSRGLFMRMIFLNEDVRKTYQFDAIIVIDTEGLCSSEKMNYPKSEQKERLMATYAIGVSNVTIVNILGEGLTEMTEILQIAFIAMTRQREEGIKPDMIMVQHLQVRDKHKVDQAMSQFCGAINEAFELISKNDVRIGTNCSECLDELRSRIHSSDLFHHFAPFKEGSSVNSPPSEKYHKDIVNLFKTIMERSKSPQGLFAFARWSRHLESYWTCVKEEDFALNFKNVKHITDFIYFEERVAKVKEHLSSAFRFHVESLSKEISETVNSKMKEKITIEREALLKEILKKSLPKLEHIPMTCSEASCKNCKEFTKSNDELVTELVESKWREDIRKTIDDHKTELKKTATKRLTQTFYESVVKQECFSEYSKLISEAMKKILNDKPDRSFTEEDKNKIDERIWKQLQDFAKSKDSGEDLKTKFHRALRQEYETVTPEIIEKFKDEITVGRQGESKLSIAKQLSQLLLHKPDFVAIEHALEEFVKQILIEKKSDCYKTGMEFDEGIVTEMKARLPTEINKLFNAPLIGKHIHKHKSIDLQVFTLQKLKQEAEELQNMWDLENKPIKLLMQKEQEYRNEIIIRLNSGFSAAGEGEIRAMKLFEATQEKALREGYRAKVEAIKDLKWMSNAQSVRLHYFRALALEVADKNKRWALNHFRSPKKAIEKWYREIVDKESNNDEIKIIALQKYNHILAQELDSLLADIRISKSKADVDAILQTCLQSLDDQYFSELDLMDDDFESFRNSIEHKLEGFARPVRLAYFKLLASEVAEKIKDRALKQYISQKKVFEKLEKLFACKNLFNRNKMKDIALKKYDRILAEELDRLLADVKASKSKADVDTIMRTCLQSVDEEYFSELDLMYDDFESFRYSFEHKLEGFLKSEENVSFPKVSNDEDIIARLGCTEQCPWCGALCWNSSEHKVGKTDDVEIQKHASCHQPSGLCGTHKHRSTELVSKPCQNNKDDDYVHFGEYRGDKRMLWSKAKKDHFNNWLLTPHSVTAFDEMMRWFFQELHEDIALQRGLVPATAQDLAANGCVGLKLNAILETVDGWK